MEVLKNNIGDLIITNFNSYISINKSSLEQENKAKVQEMQAKLVEAEAQIPLAMAEAFRSGNLGVMDYYRLRNVEADTEMRDSISKGVD